jgi:hypothetical protein
MSDLALKDRCKLLMDLWIHQNSLMWTRVQVLWFVQLGFLALAGYLFSPRPGIPGAPQPSIDAATLGALAKWVCLLCTAITFSLWIVMRTDRIIRNIYRKQLERLNCGFHPASLAQIAFGHDNGALFAEPVFVFIVFGIFVGIDLYAANVFGASNALCLGVALFLGVLAVVIPVVEHALGSPWRSATDGPDGDA